MKDISKNIDKLFKDKFSDHQAEFKPEYWDKMNNLLDKFPADGAHFSAVKILGLHKLLFFALTGIITTTIIFSLYLINNRKNITDNIINNGNNSIISDSVKQDSKVKSSVKTVVLPENNIPATKVNRIEPDKLIAKNDVLNKSNLPADNNVNSITDSGLTVGKNLSKINDSEVNQGNIPDEKKKDKQPELIKEPITGMVPIHFMLNNISPGQPYDSIRNYVKTNVFGYLDSNIMNADTANSAATSKSLFERVVIKSTFSLLTGGAVYNVFTNNQGNKDYHINPFIGLGYQYKLNKNFWLTLDGNYVRKTGNLLNRTSIRTNYFLFRETDSVKLSTKTIDFIDFNINLKYNVYHRHYISGGIFLSALINTVSERNEITASPFYTTSKSTDVKGYSEGISPFNYGFNLNYEYKWLKNSFIGIRFNQSVNDIIDDKIFLINKKDYITEFQFYIRWMLH